MSNPSLRSALGAGPNVLTQRLAELEEAGVVQRKQTGGALYELTDWGKELHPILILLGRWGAQSTRRPLGELSVDALLLALESTFVPEAAEGIDATYELRLGDERFSVQVRGRALSVMRGSPRHADAVVQTDPATLRAVAFGDLKLAAANVEMSGDTGLAKAFFRLFARGSSRGGGTRRPLGRSEPEGGTRRNRVDGGGWASAADPPCVAARGPLLSQKDK